MFRIWGWGVEGSGCKAQDLGFLDLGNQVRALDVELVVYVAPLFRWF